MAERPNILMLMADQLTASVLAAYGGPARTPRLDALASQGVVFDPVYCNSPLCAPARFSFLAGQLPSKIGAYDNAAEFAADTPTLAHFMRRAGYQNCVPGSETPLDGWSLLPELNGSDMPGEVIGEYLGEGAIAPVVMIRRGPYKFIHSPTDPDLLFDLGVDADELCNLASRQYVRNDQQLSELEAMARFPPLATRK